MARDGEIKIRWFAIPNANKTRGGLMPVITINGHHQRGDTYGRGYSKEEAERRASELAYEEAERYVGDWTLDIAKGRP